MLIHKLVIGLLNTLGAGVNLALLIHPSSADPIHLIPGALFGLCSFTAALMLLQFHTEWSEWRMHSLMLERSP